MKNVLIVLSVLVVTCATLSATVKITGDLTAQQQEKMEEISDLTKQEVEQMRQQFADIEEQEFHEAAPEKKNWFFSLLDEIARWFGLSN